MKKIILGSFMMLSGVLGIAILLAGTMADDNMINGGWSSFWVLSKYGIMPAFYILIIIGIAGLLLGIWGILDKKS